MTKANRREGALASTQPPFYGTEYRRRLALLGYGVCRSSDGGHGCTLLADATELRARRGSARRVQPLRPSWGCNRCRDGLIFALSRVRCRNQGLCDNSPALPVVLY